MDIISRLKRFIDSSNIPVTQFADRCGIPRPTLSQLLNGRNKKVSDEVISKIHTAYPALSVLWLMFGEGDMTDVPDIKTSEPQNWLGRHDSESESADTLDDMPQLDFEMTSTGNRPENLRESPSEKIGNFPPREASRNTMPTEGIARNFERTGKRVVGIVVYYDDNSYESFVPDASGRSPFAH